MPIKQSQIKLHSKVVFERLEMLKDFHRAPKIFFEDEACFLLVKQGSFDFRTPDKLITFSEGEGMIAKCGNYFIENKNTSNKQTSETVKVIGAFFYPQMVKEFFANDLSIEPFNKPITVSKVHIDSMIDQFVDNLNYIFDNPTVIDDNLILNKLKELLILLSKSEKSSSIIDFINALFTPKEYSFRETIENNIFSDLNIEQLAYLCNMSQATFKRKFKKTYNETPARYILDKKLNRAKDLLKLNSNPVSNIAYDCGFNSPSTFNKSFKKRFGLTPSEFRMT